MKILLVAHFFPPQRMAGAEQRALGYAVELQQRSHTVQVLCAGDWETGAEHWNGLTDNLYEGVRVRRVNLNWTRAEDPNRGLFDNAMVETYVDGWLTEWQPDVVHIISLITLGAGVVHVAKKHDLPVLFTLTDFWMICPKINLVRGDGSLCDGRTTDWECLRCMMGNSREFKGLTKLLPEKMVETLLTKASRHVWLSRLRGLRGMALDMAERRRVLADIAQEIGFVTAPSTHLAKVMEDNGIFSSPVRVIHSGHDLSWLNGSPEKTTGDAIRFGYIGQLIPIKGVDGLVEAFQNSMKKGNASLSIYGNTDMNPKYVASLQAMVRNGNQIHFMGPFAREQLAEVLAEIDVLVVPSRWHENNPRVIQEAFASKTPVIGANVGGIAEFIEHDVNGLLFQYDSVGDLQAQIERVVTEPDILQRLKNGIQPVKTIAEEMDEIEELYRSLITTNNRLD
jgi:glycosyltransferase involved in cell wall biosynthesis